MPAEGRAARMARAGAGVDVDGKERASLGGAGVDGPSTTARARHHRPHSRRCVTDQRQQQEQKYPRTA